MPSIYSSSFTSMLDLIEGPLNILGFKFVRLDGKMSRAMRDESIALFEKDPSVHVILISLMCGSLGLNLTAASNCFLVDPWWNPQIEQQAIDRVYRLGQTKEVTIVRFIMKSSVEERVVKRQEEKRQLASEALNDPTAGGLVANNKTREERARDRLRDIRFTLFGE
ncbi:chromatin remodeling complex subunit [Paraphysoderma sedebokerense]|nr:chromatin remodeling complex subunit [Paraphysoderma sedebokerense]